MTARPAGRGGDRGSSAVVAVVWIVLLAGCTADEPQDARFVVPTADVVDCQEHQAVPPSDAYAGDADSDTVAMLELLRYWTANGDKPYCDGQPATETDRRWASTVERLQGESDG